MSNYCFLVIVSRIFLCFCLFFLVILKICLLDVLDPEMPEHDLEPPRFAKKALEKLLTNWTAVKSMILGGCKEINKQNPIEEDEYYLLSQEGVTYLDRFTYALLVKCQSEVIEYFNFLQFFNS